MAIRDWFRKAPFMGRRSTSSISSWTTPPDMNTKGYLSAYGQIYSLFGIALRIATGMGEVKWRLYRGSERSERSQISEHPILKLLDFANEFQTGQEIIELTSIHMDLAGRAYWYLPRNGLGVPGEVWVLPPHLMKPIPDEMNFIKGYIYTHGNEQIPFATNEIIRFPMPDPINPYGGVGYAQAAAVELDSESYAGKWNRNFFYNSARADAVLETEGRLNDEQYEQLRSQWKGQHQGLSRAHKVAILEGGLTYKQIQVSQKDMDFPNLRRQTRENLLFTFGMPLSVMGISENVNRANAEAGDYTFARWLIKPRLTRIKNKLNEQLLPMFPQAKNGELDFDEVVPETIEQKKSLAESGVKAGYMTINEGRKLTGLDPIPSGDILLIPLNMIPTPTDEELPTNNGESIEVSVDEPSRQISGKGFTDEQKEARWLIYIQKTERQEGLFRTILKSLFAKQAKEVIGNLENYGVSTDPFDSIKSDRKFSKAFDPILNLILFSAYEDVESELTAKSYKQFGLRNPLAEEWIAKRSLASAKLINGTTKTALRATLKEGFELGEGIPALTKRVETLYGNANKARAKLVARTETISASNQGALLGYKDNGVQKAEFFTALDERVCEECEPLHGRIFPVDEAQGVIPIHPACRCTFLPIVSPDDAPEVPEKPQGLTEEEWKESLTRDERQALGFWQGSGYERIREAQQSGKLTGSLRGAVKNMNAALDKAVAYKGEVYRGLNNLNATAFKTISNSNQFKWNAFSSGASKEKAAARFLRGEKGRSVMFRIQNKTGIDITPLLRGESEILMRKNATFKVVSKQMKTYTVGKDKFEALEMVLMEL